MGSKGIPHHMKLQMQDYENALFTENAHYVQIKSLQLRDGKMARTTTVKAGLCDIFVKYRLDEDGITCSPLSANGKLL